MITIQIGQCGNQIGEKLFETLTNDLQNPSSFVNAANRFKPHQIPQADYRQNENYVEEAKQRFFNEREDIKETMLTPRAVLIDMESKVVNKLVKKQKCENDNANYSYQFRESNSYTQKKGSGNNW